MGRLSWYLEKGEGGRGSAPPHMLGTLVQLTDPWIGSSSSSSSVMTTLVVSMSPETLAALPRATVATSAGSMKVPCASSPVACTSPASASSPPDARMSRALAAGLGVREQRLEHTSQRRIVDGVIASQADLRQDLVRAAGPAWS